MAMILTKDDLTALSDLIDDRVSKLAASPSMLEATENRLMARIDDLDDVLSLQMEHGLQEIRDQLAEVDGRLSAEIAEIKVTVSRIDRVQQAELHRNDHQDAAIKQIRKNLHAA